MTTIAVSNNTRKQLMELKLKENYRSVDELLEKMIIEHKIAKLTEVSKLFRERMEKYNLTLEDLSK